MFEEYHSSTRSIKHLTTPQHTPHTEVNPLRSPTASAALRSLPAPEALPAALLVALRRRLVLRPVRVRHRRRGPLRGGPLRGDRRGPTPDPGQREGVRPAAAGEEDQAGALRPGVPLVHAGALRREERLEQRVQQDDVRQLHEALHRAAGRQQQHDTAGGEQHLSRGEGR